MTDAGPSFCGQCGGQVVAGSIFCSECGERVDASPSTPESLEVPPVPPVPPGVAPPVPPVPPGVAPPVPPVPPGVAPPVPPVPPANTRPAEPGSPSAGPQPAPPAPSGFPPVGPIVSGGPGDPQAIPPSPLTSPDKQAGRRKVVVGVAAVVAVVLIAAIAGLGASDDSGNGDAERANDSTSSTTLPEEVTGGSNPDEPGSWTLMVYAVGDNDLEADALVDLAEMSTVDSSENLNLIAMLDRSEGYTDEEVPGVGDWVGARSFELGDGEAVELEDYGEVNSGDPDTLSRFISETASQYPADHYGVVIWDHGAGWIGIGPDEGHMDLLEVSEITGALDEAADDAGIERFDLLGFDACAMATFEVATSLSGNATYMVASEELEPGHGWDYSALGELADEPATTQEVGQLLLDGYEAQAREEDQHRRITLSMVDLREIEPLNEAVGELASSLADDPEKWATAFGIQRSETLTFARDPNPANALNLADLGAFVDGLADVEPDLADPALAVKEALDEMVVSQVRGPAMRRASGLAVYFPQFPGDADPMYQQVAADTPWQTLLASYLEQGGEIPEEELPSFVNEASQAEWFFDEDGLNMLGTFDLASEENLVEAIIYYGVPDASDGSIIFLGEEPGEILYDGSGTAGAIYDLTVLQLSDGEDTAFAYLDMTIDEEAGIAVFDIPLAYYEPGETADDEYQDILLSVVMELESEEFTETFYIFNESGTVAEFTPELDGVLVPLVQNLYPDGSIEWIPTSDVGLWADISQITYEFVPFEPGDEIYAELTVFDYGGNSDYVYMQDIVP